jgi:hypothetical protein
MTSKTKPVEVALTGQSRAKPEQPLVRLPDELEDADLENVAGGALLPSSIITVQTVSIPIGVGSFHLGAWST